ncbi:hypothetical protein EVAR_85294_1 [Eumeta japonica]|uniref:Uncharacterized protein n=1 Tax=Eumeta variegata TaxID=151549 RepID=A0A4C1V9F2_EUMVA|nr:hypothetical protein EVAR_85294_1 [Eumeta japonica]
MLQQKLLLHVRIIGALRAAHAAAARADATSGVARPTRHCPFISPPPEPGPVLTSPPSAYLSREIFSAPLDRNIIFLRLKFHRESRSRHELSANRIYIFPRLAGIKNIFVTDGAPSPPRPRPAPPAVADAAWMEFIKLSFSSQQLPRGLVFDPSPVLNFASSLAFVSDPGPNLNLALRPALYFDSTSDHSSDLNEAGEKR